MTADEAVLAAMEVETERRRRASALGLNRYEAARLGDTIDTVRLDPPSEWLTWVHNETTPA